MGEIATILVLLLACLIALLLVLLARREAAATRSRAESDVHATRAEARSMLAEVERREARLEERERDLAEDRAAVRLLERQVTEDLAAAERVTAEAEERHRQSRQVLDQARAEADGIVAAVTGLSADEARAEQVRRVTDAATNEAAALVRRIEARARQKAEARALRVVSTAVQRIAGRTSSQAVVTVLALPGEEMKGRIIGKEGRNIRTFEALTGVNVIVDDSPDTVMLSSFDAERREVAAVALASLIEDGRIHPQRIELAYAEALAGADARTVAAGHAAAEEAEVADLHPEMIETLGRLRHRTSYGQNVLAHLVECARIAAAMAAELGADVELARRAAFLHDVGKALTHQVAGTHAHVGAELARRLGESPAVVNAIAAHHDEVPVETVEGVLVQAADACSAARPGARREELDQYIERMETLESLVTDHPGVRRALAMAAGREVRVVVEPHEVTDAELPAVAETIARHIEKDLSYPGEITVTVVRELRASATAG